MPCSRCVQASGYSPKKNKIFPSALWASKRCIGAAREHRIKAFVADVGNPADAQATGERWGEAELYRLRGDLLLRQTGTQPEEAETWLRKALDVARRQEAKALELRAAVSLSRLWQQQGKQDEARELLTPIYSWFTEGFDTADLQEAKGLLDELGA
jgi:predicted ATPase